jgi:hypothetical protein
MRGRRGSWDGLQTIWANSLKGRMNEEEDKKKETCKPLFMLLLLQRTLDVL